MKILGIETTCDETAVGIVKDGKFLLSNTVLSSMDLQSVYGGVVPELAARSHVEAIIPVIKESLKQARVGWQDIDGIAVAHGAGLGGSLLIGVMTARTLAILKSKPLYKVNHIESHVFANFITDTSLDNYKLPKAQPEFPMLALIVSGGHSQLVLFEDYFGYEILGQTYDDAIGEAFDKVAKIVGLPYPGGPSVEKAAREGNPHAYDLPKAKMKGKYDFSFSGVKTAVLRLAQREIGKGTDFPSFEISKLLSRQQVVDICASFVRVASETVVDKTYQAFIEYQPKSVVIGGGVASSPELRRQLEERLPIAPIYTDPKLCTDNGAMIATLGYFEAVHKKGIADPYSLAINPSLSM